MPTPPQSDREKLRKEWFEQTPYRCNCRTYGEETCAYHKCIADWWLDKMFPEKCQGHPRSRYCTGSHPCTCSTPNKSSLTAFDTAEKELAKEIDEKTESSLRDAGFPEGSQAAGNLVILPTPAKSPSPSGEINYLHVGEMTACGHCEPDKFGTGLRQAEKAYPDFKCTCKCHTPTSPVEEGWDWKREFDEKFSVSDDQLGKSKYGTPTFYPASRIKSFIRSAISRAVGEYEEKMAHKCYEHEQIARKEERKSIGENLIKIDHDNGRDIEIAMNDVLRYADHLITNQEIK